jgi:hypothetical protein
MEDFWNTFIAIMIGLPFLMWFALVPLARLFDEAANGLADLAELCGTLLDFIRR